MLTRPGPRMVANAALRASSKPYGSTIWWPNVGSVSKRPSVLVPPAQSHMEELLAAMQMDIDFDVTHGTSPFAPPKLSGTRTACALRYHLFLLFFVPAAPRTRLCSSLPLSLSLIPAHQPLSRCRLLSRRHFARV